LIFQNLNPKKKKVYCYESKKWRIKLNESKSVHTDFTNKGLHNDTTTQIPYANTGKYLCMKLSYGVFKKYAVVVSYLTIFCFGMRAKARDPNTLK
jgi:hypothetical protein